MTKNQEPNLEKRLIIAVLMSLGILFATQYAYQELYPPATPTQEERPLPVGSSGSPEEAPGVASEEPQAAAAPPLVPEVELVPTEAEAMVIEIETEVLYLRINTSGGVIESIRLKEYRTEEERPLELLPQDAVSGMGKLLQVRLGEPILDERLATMPYVVNGSGIEGEPLEFIYRDQAVSVRKTLQIPAGGYAFGLRVEVERNGSPSPFAMWLGPGIGGGQPQTESDFTWPRITYYADGAATRYYEDDIEGSPVIMAGPRWVAVDSQYFTYGLFAPGLIREFTMLRASVTPETPPEGDSAEEKVQVATYVTLPPVTEGILFVGPKEGEMLSSIDDSLDALIDYGWFEFFVKPLIFFLKYTNNYAGNYGWSIIILTFLINLVLVPVRYKQTVSMKRMSELQPKIKSIQDKYKRMKKDDPKRQQMNVELMGLYREHGVNPLGGCLPLLLQMPILFAFYSMLQVVIELRGAPFIWWIQDLSKPDPYLITPIVMGGTMMAQQKMTPSTADPAQKRIMMIMPVVFTFMFLYVSSGLALYFLFSNVFAMAFQVLLQRFKPDLAPGKKGSRKSKKKK